MRERRRHRERLGVSAVYVAAGRAKVWTKILIARVTELANTVRGMNPCEANTIAFSKAGDTFPKPSDSPHHLMSRYEWVVRSDETPFGEIEVGPADAAHVDPHQELAVARHWCRNVTPLEWTPRTLRRRRHWPVQEHCAHASTLAESRDERTPHPCLPCAVDAAVGRRRASPRCLARVRQVVSDLRRQRSSRRRERALHEERSSRGPLRPPQR